MRPAQPEIRAEVALNKPGREHGLAGIAQSEKNRAPDIAVAKEICHDRGSHGAENAGPTRAGTERDQGAGGTPRRRPENRNTFGLGQESKTEPGRDEIGDADRNSEPD